MRGWGGGGSGLRGRGGVGDAEVVQDFCRVTRRIDARINLHDFAVLIDHVCDWTIETEDRNSVGGAVRGCDLLVGIAQPREGQAVLADEILVRVGRIDPASEYDQARVGVARIAVAEGTRLFGASRGFIL